MPHDKAGSAPNSNPSPAAQAQRPIPMWLLAELTYACPLQCPYCSNPLDFHTARSRELTTAQWIDVMQQARKLGAVQLGFSGGEPLVRKDLPELIDTANQLGFYSNLITSSVGLDEEKIHQFKKLGLNHIQISFQGADRESNQRFGGTDSFDHKSAMTKAVIAADLPLGLNFVLHRHNIHQVEQFLDTALSLGAEFVELANSQYYGWALHNREHLMPSLEQLQEAERVTQRFRERHPNKMDVFFVAPDYFETRPKKCCNGWGTTFMTVTPEGDVLPCQSAKVIPGIEFPNVREQKLESIWHDSQAFNQFRGLDWMVEPCKSCPEREIDLGGCRCQAYLLTGDARNADPVCDLSPHHHIVTEAVAAARAETEGSEALVWRNPRNAKKVTSNTTPRS